MVESFILLYCIFIYLESNFFLIAPDLQGATPTTVASESSEEEDDQLPQESQPLLTGKTVTIAMAPVITLDNPDEDEGDVSLPSDEEGERKSSGSDQEHPSDEDEDDDDVRFCFHYRNHEDVYYNYL